MTSIAALKSLSRLVPQNPCLEEAQDSPAMSPGAPAALGILDDPAAARLVDATYVFEQGPGLIWIEFAFAEERPANLVSKLCILGDLVIARGAAG
jgi:hypothetical protein